MPSEITREDAIDRILDFFSAKSVDIDDSTVSAADMEFVQVEVHRRFAAFAARLGERVEINGDKPYAEAARRFREDVAPYVASRAKIGHWVPHGRKVDLGVSFISDTPILIDDVWNALSSTIEIAFPIGETAAAADGFSVLLAAYIVSFREIMPDYDVHWGGPVRALMATAFSWIAEAKRRRQRIELGSGQAGAIDFRLKETAQLVEKFRAELLPIRLEIEEIRQQKDDYQEQARSAEAEFRKIAGNIEAIAVDLQERLSLKETQRLWGTRSTLYAIGYYMSLAVLLSLLIATPIVAYFYRADILALVAEIEGSIKATPDAVSATIVAAGRLLLIGVPVAALVWALKLLVRYNMRSLLLMDDARQRVTMLHTYLFMVRQKVATQQDRGALLEAMFRRAPGHGPDTIEPPNMTDVMKYGEVMKT